MQVVQIVERWIRQGRPATGCSAKIAMIERISGNSRTGRSNRCIARSSGAGSGGSLPVNQVGSVRGTNDTRPAQTSRLCGIRRVCYDRIDDAISPLWIGDLDAGSGRVERTGIKAKIGTGTGVIEGYVEDSVTSICVFCNRSIIGVKGTGSIGSKDLLRNWGKLLL